MKSMKVDEMKKIGVVGAGTMGSGIAQLFASHGKDVLLYDLYEKALETGISEINNNLTKLYEEDWIQQSLRDEIIGRINSSIDIKDLHDVDFVIETATEKMQIKKEIFKQLDEITMPNIILATSTSSLSVFEIAIATKRADKVVGMHFFNPPTKIKLVEVVSAMTTSDRTEQFVFDVAQSIGKEPVKTKDIPGFIVNRVLIPMLNEAVFAYQDGVGTIDEIDKAMKLGTNMPMGPLELIDYIGVDVVVSIMEVLYKENKDSKYIPASSLRKMIRAGNLGRNTGKGFYEY